MRFRRVYLTGLATLISFALSGPPAAAAVSHADTESAAERSRAESGPKVELFFTLRSALRLGKHPVLATLVQAQKALNPDGAAESAKTTRGFVRDRIRGPIDAIQEVRDAEPGRALAVLTPEALSVPDIAAMIDETVVAIPVGGDLVLVTKLPPRAPRKP